MQFDHYIAVDWAQSNMAIARMTAKADKIETRDVPASVVELRAYLRHLKGTKILTLEEASAAQWLYTELKDEVDELVICDPRRNHLLSEGPKTDKIDAQKLVRLLRANMLKPVFHSADDFIHLRKLVSAYEDTVKAGVRLRNQRTALFRAKGLTNKETTLPSAAEQFVLAGFDAGIEAYEQEKARYEAEFERWRKKHKMIGNLETIPGIGTIGAVKVAAAVVDARRFANRNAFISFCGLVKHDRLSGGKSYGKKTPHYSRRMKSVFKTAALSSVERCGARSPFKRYYDYLVGEKRYASHNARHAVARRVATLAFGVMKSGKKFDERSLKPLMPLK